MSRQGENEQAAAVQLHLIRLQRDGEHEAAAALERLRILLPACDAVAREAFGRVKDPALTFQMLDRVLHMIEPRTAPASDGE